MKFYYDTYVKTESDIKAKFVVLVFKGNGEYYAI